MPNAAWTCTKYSLNSRNTTKSQMTTKQGKPMKKKEEQNIDYLFRKVILKIQNRKMATHMLQLLKER